MSSATPTWNRSTVADALTIKLSERMQKIRAGITTAALNRMVGKVGKQMLEDGQEVIREARLITPVDTGELRASGAANLVNPNPDNVFVDLSFGGPSGSGNVDGETNMGDVDYAVFVHEDMTMRHPNGGQAKFLETAFLEVTPAIVEHAGTAFTDALQDEGLL